MSALSLQDQLEIQQLYARYNHAIDFGRAAEWAQTFTPDGTFDGVMGKATGTQALTAFAEHVFRTTGPSRHWINSLVVEGDGGRAMGSCYLIFWQLVEDQPPVARRHLHHEDELVRTADGWRFAVRRVIPDVSLPANLE